MVEIVSRRARFGPNGIRQGSRVVNAYAFNVLLGVKITDNIDVIDCGDVPMTTMDNKVSLRQLENAARELIGRQSSHSYEGQSLAKDAKFHSRILTLVCIHIFTIPLSQLAISLGG